MTKLKELYTLTEATEFMGLPERDMLRYVYRGYLPICFDFDGELLYADITYEDGTTEHVDLPVPINGVLKSLAAPRGHESLTASSVLVLYLNEGGVTYQDAGGELLEWEHGALIEDAGGQFVEFSDGIRKKPQGKLVHHNGRLIEIRDPKRVKGHKLPTQSKYDVGYIRPGCCVEGFVDFVEIPASDWLFHRDDLHALLTSAVAETPGGSIGEPVAAKAAFSAQDNSEDTAEPIWNGARSAQMEDTGDVVGLTEEEDDATSEDDLARLFDPVPVAALEKMFPSDGRWKTWAERANRNGLSSARQDRAMFNPFIAARWFLQKGQEGWDWARCLRVLANNLPPRSKDHKHLLTGTAD